MRILLLLLFVILTILTFSVSKPQSALANNGSVYRLLSPLSDRVLLTNGPLIFTDSQGASWTDNNLTLTINPGVVNNPFAQVGNNFPNRVISRTDPLLPANIVGLDFNINFNPYYPSWVFAIATYDLPYNGDNTGVIFICNACAEPVGEVHTGYIDKLTDPTDRHLQVVKVRNGKIRLDLNHPFFSNADVYSMAFQITPASLPPQETSFGFLDIKWVTHD
jgi:hypothetical protein